MKTYKHIFFDLDHTLWDFQTNSRLALSELFRRYQLQSLLSTDLENFLKTYYQVNEEKWRLYRNNQIDKARLRFERVRDTLLAFEYEDDHLCENFEREYLEISPLQSALLPNTLETLRYLQPKYQLHIITNGFREVQHLKLKNSSLLPFFQHIVTSEEAGVNKPDPAIFQYSMDLCGARCEESVMVGDSLEADILGARACGIDQVFFNPASLTHKEQLKWEIKDIKELQTIL